MKKQSNNTITEARTMTAGRSLKKIEQLVSLLPFGIGTGKPVVAVLRLDGVIGKVGVTKSGLTLCSLNPLIEKAFKIERLKAVCLCINSPGGSPVQSELIANRIIELAKEKDIPVYSFIEDVAASGGYWLACAGNKIFASKSSLVGSIGVISSGFGFHEAIGRVGIERRVYTQGKTKSVLDPFQPEKESDIKIIKKIQKEIHEHFINSVKARRGGKLTQSDDILFNGEFWSGQVAVDYGLVDEINNLYTFIKSKFGDEVKIEHIEQKQPWFKKKLGISFSAPEFADTLANSVIDAVENKLSNGKFNLR
ncbi:MAG: S49 family peptidase [Rickettsiaceae bacterium]